MDVTRLYEQRASVWHEMKSMLDIANKEYRDFTAEEAQRYDALNADLDSKAEMIARAERAAQYETSLTEVRRDPRILPGSTADVRAEAGEAEYRKAFNTFLRTGADAELRAMSKGTTTAGGFTVPTGFATELMSALYAECTMRQTRARVVTTDSGEDIPFPIKTVNPSVALVGEGSTITPSDATFASVTLKAFGYKSIQVVSRELLNDSAFDIESEIARMVGEEIAREQNGDFVNGAGTTLPKGIFVASSLGKTGASGQTATLIADDIIDLFYSVNTSYRRNGEWMMNDATAKAIRKLKDGNDQYMWQPGLLADQSDTLMGKPVHVDADAPVMATSAKSIVFGDFSRYIIRDVKGIYLRRLDETYAANDQVGFLAVVRSDGNLVDLTGAVKHYVNAAS